MKNLTLFTKNKLLTASFAVSLSLLTACGGGKQETTNTDAAVDNSPVISLALPDSMTGGTPTTALLTANQQSQVVSGTTNDAQIITNVVSSNAKSSDDKCQFVGDSDEDHFKNSYKMTKFMVAAVASWTCISDTLIHISNFVAHDGVIVETDNDTTASNYKAGEPTHYSVTDDSETQTTIRVYYRYPRNTPPRVGDDPQFFVSWNERGLNTIDREIEGRLVIDGIKIQADARKAEDPTMMRMDFNYTLASKNVDMFLQFDNGNEWADGFRINVSKDLTVDPLSQVYLARGLIKMKKQFLPVTGITEVPNVQLYTVSDLYGKGAAISEFQNISLPLELNAATNNHLGNYLFTKTDTYYFRVNQGWDWVNKSITVSEYRGSRTTTATGGNADDLSLDLIVTGLNLDPDYFTGTQCVNIGDDCNELLNAIYRDGFHGHEKNDGVAPNDWRNTALVSPDYLNSVYPNGADWFGAFNFSFTPSLN